MIEAGVSALDRWAERYGVDDVPAAEELVRSILDIVCLAKQSQRITEAERDGPAVEITPERHVG
jgi:hypothetical protein